MPTTYPNTKSSSFDRFSQTYEPKRIIRSNQWCRKAQETWINPSTQRYLRQTCTKKRVQIPSEMQPTSVCEINFVACEYSERISISLFAWKHILMIFVNTIYVYREMLLTLFQSIYLYPKVPEIKLHRILSIILKTYHQLKMTKMAKFKFWQVVITNSDFLLPEQIKITKKYLLTSHAVRS